MIPIYQPDLTEKEKSNVLRCLESTWISSKGYFIDRFEEALRSFTGAHHASTVCNGTVAIHLALHALGLKHGDEVLVPSFTYVASANPILQIGAVPVFVDCDPETWQMNVDQLNEKLTDRTKGVIAVHIYGHASPIMAIRKFCDKNSLFLVEDCAEALGTFHGEVHVGNFGDLGTFSFFGNKTITCGEGGAIVTNSAALAERVALLKNQGMDPHRRYWHTELAFNYRMTNLQAAIGLAQIERVDETLQKKRILAQKYIQIFKTLGLKTQEERAGTIHSYWMNSVLCEDKLQKEKVVTEFENSGIETRPLFPPLHTMPMFKRNGVNLPISEKLHLVGLNLPSWPGMNQEQFEKISHALTKAVKTT